MNLDRGSVYGNSNYSQNVTFANNLYNFKTGSTVYA